MNMNSRRLRTPSLGLAALALVAGCRPIHEQPQGLPPAYTFNRIEDPDLLRAVEEVRGWAAEQSGAGEQALYSKIEILPPVPTVQPYGVGVYQQEVRLPVILTTGPGWKGLSPDEKEAKVADAFREAAERLSPLNRGPLLQPTLTIQTPEGIELSWVNHLDVGGKNVHGDD
jgi:hypothetical protein